MTLFRMLAPAATALMLIASQPAAAQNAKADVTAGATALQRGDYATAVTRTTRAIDGQRLSGGDLGEAYRTRAAAYLAQNDFPNAYKDVEQAISLLPNDSQAFAIRCHIFLRRGLAGRALQDANTALERNARNADAYACRGAINVIARAQDKAVADFTLAIQYGSTTPGTYNSRGLAHAFRGDYQAAIADFDQAISQGGKAQPWERAEWLVNRARARSALRQYDAALRDVGEAIQLDAGTPLRQAEWYVSRARIQAQKGDTDAAIADIDQALKVGAAAPGPQRSPWLEERGSIHARAGRYDLALKDFNAAIEGREGVPPGQVAAWYSMRGRIQMVLGQESLALVDFNQALQMRPNNPDLLAERGMAKLRRDAPGAKADFDAALAKEPNHVPATVGQAWLAAESGNFDAAIAAAERVVASQAANDLAYQLRGTFRFLRGQFDAAAADFTEAQQRDPNNQQAPAWRAAALARANKPEGVAPGQTAWPVPVMSLFANAADPATVESAAKAADAGRGRIHECEAHFFIGEYWLLRRDNSRARAAFEKAIATNMTTVPEHAAARYELARLRR